MRSAEGVAALSRRAELKIIGGRYGISIRQWTGDEGSMTVDESKGTWVTISGLPLHCWELGGFQDVLRAFGTVVDMDAKTLAKRGGTARVKIVLLGESILPRWITVLVENKSFLTELKVEEVGGRGEMEGPTGEWHQKKAVTKKLFEEADGERTPMMRAEIAAGKKLLVVGNDGAGDQEGPCNQVAHNAQGSFINLEHELGDDPMAGEFSFGKSTKIVQIHNGVKEDGVRSTSLQHAASGVQGLRPMLQGTFAAAEVQHTSETHVGLEEYSRERDSMNVIGVTEEPEIREGGSTQHLLTVRDETVSDMRWTPLVQLEKSALLKFSNCRDTVGGLGGGDSALGIGVQTGSNGVKMSSSSGVKDPMCRGVDNNKEDDPQIEELLKKEVEKRVQREVKKRVRAMLGSWVTANKQNSEVSSQSETESNKSEEPQSEDDREVLSIAKEAKVAESSKKTKAIIAKEGFRRSVRQQSRGDKPMTVKEIYKKVGKRKSYEYIAGEEQAKKIREMYPDVAQQGNREDSQEREGTPEDA